MIFQHQLWLLPNYCELFYYPWLMYVKLIIGAGDQRLLMGTKRGTYNCHSFNCAYTTSIVKSLKRQTFCKLINFESTHATHKHAIKCKNGVFLKKWLMHFQQEVWKTTWDIKEDQRCFWVLRTLPLSLRIFTLSWHTYIQLIMQTWNVP